MYCSILSAAICGIEALPVRVEADVSDGLPVFNMVGYVSSQVREAQDRVRTSLKNIGLSMPPKRITINLSPGVIRKEGTRFDLPIAAAVLAALSRIPAASLLNTMLIGELKLNGGVLGITGVLPSVLKARESGCRCCLIPYDNLREGLCIDGIRVVGIRSLQDLIDFCTGRLKELPPPRETYYPPAHLPDFSDIRGQDSVKRASVIAAAGFHNLLMSGPPGSGKSMAARRIPSIMPPLSEEESLELSQIYSIVGNLPAGDPLLHARPFRSPHHTISESALTGGGLHPRPGEITLAHHGVLFLDELPEMNPHTIELLRQPLETHDITIARSGGTYTFPASFLLVAAMNPCPCGYYPDRNRCRCTMNDIDRYQARISHAFLDRIDLRTDVKPVSYDDLADSTPGSQSSSSMREMVIEACEIQKERYKKYGIRFNSQMTPSDIRRFCPLSPEASAILQNAFSNLGMSARAYHRVLKVARTIADLDSSELICQSHIEEALYFRFRENQTE
ncbi:MAG: YifB family Mg chelatase-like AAA ATPase [Eubacterium sp.]|nr:YifB family Mg chelatase-like AAA ATPase [Eubacterium sp.]